MPSHHPSTVHHHICEEDRVAADDEFASVFHGSQSWSKNRGSLYHASLEALLWLVRAVVSCTDAFPRTASCCSDIVHGKRDQAQRLKSNGVHKSISALQQHAFCAPSCHFITLNKLESFARDQRLRANSGTEARNSTANPPSIEGTS